MKKRFLAVIAGGFLLVAVGFRSDDSGWEKAFARIDAEVKKNSRAYQTLGEATKQIGHRLTGSPNGQKAEEYAFNLLKSYGFSDVKYQPFEVESWMRDTVTLSIAPKNSDNFRDVAVVALAHSPVEADLSADIVDVGNGLEEDFEAAKDKVKGKIALANIGMVGATGKKTCTAPKKRPWRSSTARAGSLWSIRPPVKSCLPARLRSPGRLFPFRRCVYPATAGASSAPG